MKNPNKTAEKIQKKHTKEELKEEKIFEDWWKGIKKIVNTRGSLQKK